MGVSCVPLVVRVVHTISAAVVLVVLMVLVVLLVASDIIKTLFADDGRTCTARGPNEAM